MRRRSFRIPGVHNVCNAGKCPGTGRSRRRRLLGWWKPMERIFVKYLRLLMFAAISTHAAAQPAAEWIDKDTGHRVVRISRQPGTQSLYFHQNAYTPQGDVLIVNSPNGIQAVSLKTWSVRTVVPGKVTALFVAHKSRSVFFSKREGADAGEGPSIVYAADIDSGAVRQVAKIPFGM